MKRNKIHTIHAIYIILSILCYPYFFTHCQQFRNNQNTSDLSSCYIISWIIEDFIQTHSWKYLQAAWGISIARTTGFKSDSCGTQWMYNSVAVYYGILWYLGTVAEAVPLEVGRGTGHSAVESRREAARCFCVTEMMTWCWKWRLDGQHTHR